MPFPGERHGPGLGVPCLPTQPHDANKCTVQYAILWIDHLNCHFMGLAKHRTSMVLCEEVDLAFPQFVFHHYLRYVLSTTADFIPDYVA